MAISGVTLEENVRGAIDDLRMKKSRYVMMCIGADGKKIEVTEVGERSVNYTDLKEKFSTEKPCYVAFDFEYNDAGSKREKLILIQWIPDTARPREKMMYSASRDALSSVSEGYLPIQANDESGLDAEEIIRKVRLHRSV
ncbi:ADF/Cofilin [Leishmania donovani]|uniref:ADF/Cofilin n=1 Tax=Leishmania donovani TaxID=5661 RepID=A0A3S7X2A7_LEIDO|nr:cofilin-like protein [Leishmania donovani]AYU80537.1 ADF/Cofilin [Leishmania donovani]TPP50850.1 Cofilin/tropomyosin-type actin-binding family protein [Leishmania donovani]TPP52686.1 Cofilin/tropomyosin-type actin-binding family protein [Leishmania donovani]CAJ1990521.1 ADF/Cofilin [Leishmania donovani]CBZ35776.1 cofilin-like protein [Leishmania donovani]